MLIISSDSRTKDSRLACDIHGCDIISLEKRRMGINNQRFFQNLFDELYTETEVMIFTRGTEGHTTIKEDVVIAFCRSNGIDVKIIWRPPEEDIFDAYNLAEGVDDVF